MSSDSGMDDGAVWRKKRRDQSGYGKEEEVHVVEAGR